MTWFYVCIWTISIDLIITIWTIWLFSIANEFPDSKRRIYSWYPGSCKTVGVYIYGFSWHKALGFHHLDGQLTNTSLQKISHMTSCSWDPFVLKNTQIIWSINDVLSSSESTGMWSIVQCVYTLGFLPFNTYLFKDPRARLQVYIMFTDKRFNGIVAEIQLTHETFLDSWI